ncbi:STAS domain-containing protein [Streptomyces sp. HD]|uniref:STAS domain-containing protein n=1 Tax=Streptomyces sp. HD TaxID=3020892 RepID=UPI00232D259A|nr:STAS domain-containing protein [Streptomyces sp. HD]MDC0768437.1 STAS domain-containing protein [Streptomyces sp. HD]
MPGNAAPPTQNVRTYETAGRTIIELLGDIDIAVALRISAQLDATTGRPETLLVIDLSPVEFLDCSGLRLLCRARRRVEERGGHLTLVCPHPVIRKLLRIVGLSQVFALTGTLDEALDSGTSAD